MNAEVRVTAIVVTYNRRNLLRECLHAILKQTRPPDEVLVIDNACTDGTPEMLADEFPQVTHVRLPENRGGAGGFYEGIKRAYQKGHDWFWIMDDDSEPQPDALERLLEVKDIEPDIGFLCSHVVYPDGSVHRMNIPGVMTFVYQDKQPHPFNVHVDKGLIRVQVCSFVSVLFSRKAVRTVGFPIPEMFIYCDDIEYTYRVSQKFPCYYVIRSVVVHKTPANTGVDIRNVPVKDLWRCFYDVRNQTYFRRKMGKLSFLRYSLLEFPGYMKRAFQRDDRRLQAWYTCVRGYLAGILFRPSIEYPEMQNTETS